MANIDLKKTLPTALINDFWEDFMDVLSGELELLRSKIIEKKTFFNVREQNDTVQLTEISKTTGYDLDRSINDSIGYIKNNLNLSPYRVKHKTTYTGYNYIFSLAEYFGKVYVFSVINSLFTRGLDETKIISNLNAITNYALPFKDFDAELYFKSSSVTGISLDETPTWYFDGSTYSSLDEELTRSPTTHLAIEYTPDNLITENSIEYYMNNTYLEYLTKASLYNKKSTEFPHTGTQINCILDQSGYYDNLSNSSYSTPLLKLNCTTTTKNYYLANTSIFLDQSTGMGTYAMDLDLEVPWTLDQQTNDEFADEAIDTLFYTLEFGNGYKGTVSKDYPNINQNLFFYFPLDETSGATIDDKSNNNYSGTFYNNYSREQGVIGYGIKLADGSYGLSDPINIQPNRETINFWIKGKNSNQKYNIVTLFHIYKSSINYLKIDYNTVEKKIRVYMTGNYISYYYDILDDNEHMVTVIYNSDVSTYSLYLDGIFIDDQSFSTSLSNSGEYTLYFGTNKDNNTYFIGTIDEFRGYSRILTSNEINFLYTSKLGDIETLGNLLYTNTQITHRIENDDWYIISGRLDFKSEIQTIIDDDITYPSNQEKKLAIDNLYGESINIKEFGIRNQSGEMKVYSTFPTVQMKKKNHISIQCYIKK